MIKSGNDRGCPEELQPHILELQPHILELQPHILELQPHIGGTINKAKLSPAEAGAWAELGNKLSPAEAGAWAELGNIYSCD